MKERLFGSPHSSHERSHFRDGRQPLGDSTGCHGRLAGLETGPRHLGLGLDTVVVLGREVMPRALSRQARVCRDVEAIMDVTMTSEVILALVTLVVADPAEVWLGVTPLSSQHSPKFLLALILGGVGDDVEVVLEEVLLRGGFFKLSSFVSHYNSTK